MDTFKVTIILEVPADGPNDAHALVSDFLDDEADIDWHVQSVAVDTNPL